MTLRPADQLVSHAVAETINALDLGEKDAAAAALAREYARMIDEYGRVALEELGPKLLAVLQALGATPAARARLQTGGPADAAENRLTRLRQAAR